MNGKVRKIRISPDIYQRIDALCKEDWPYYSPAHKELAALWKTRHSTSHLSVDCLNLLCLLLYEAKKYGSYLFDSDLRTRDLISSLLKYRNHDVQYRRYCLYKEYKAQKPTDVEIYKRIYEQEAGPGKRVNFRTFLDRMRKWKRDNITILEELKECENLFNDTSKDDWISGDVERAVEPGDCVKPEDAAASEKAPDPVTADNAAKRLFMDYRLCKDIYHIYQSPDDETFICRIIESLNEKRTYYGDWIQELNELNAILSEIIYVFRPELYVAVLVIKHGDITKAPIKPYPRTTNNDIHRAIEVKARKYTHNTVETTLNSLRRGKYAEAKKLLDEKIEPKVALKNKIMAFLTDRSFIEFLDRDSAAKKITTWSGVLEFAEPYLVELDVTPEMLKDILDICAEQRDWILPDEFLQMQRFKSLQLMGFFDELHKRLVGKCEGVPNIRWHRVPIPDDMNMLSITQLKNGYIYSPLWTEKKKVAKRKKKRRKKTRSPPSGNKS